MRSLNSAVVIFSLSIVAQGCSKNEVIIVPPAEVNVEPTVTNQVNAFSLSVIAETLSFNRSYDLTFTADTAQYDLVVAGHTHGTGALVVLSEDSIQIHADSLTQQATVRSLRMRGRVPGRVTFSLHQFSGSISLILMVPSEPSQPYSFPLGVGSNWVYALYDSLSLLRDTVDLRIIGKTVTAGGMSAVWVYQWKHNYWGLGDEDTLFVTFTGDTLHFFNFRSSRTERLKLLFPLMVGNRWGIGGDTTAVISQDTVTIPRGTFPGCFQIKRRITNIPESLISVFVLDRPRRRVCKTILEFQYRSRQS